MKFTEIVVQGRGILWKNLPHLFSSIKEKIRVDERWHRSRDVEMIMREQNGSIKAENRRDVGAGSVKFYKHTVV